MPSAADLWLLCQRSSYPTVTHAAMKACAEGQCLHGPAEASLRFYTFGLAPNHINDMLRLHLESSPHPRGDGPHDAL